MDPNHIIIKKFLDNEMSPEELKSFQDRLKSDKVLAEELSITTDLKKILTDDKKHKTQTENLEKTLDDLGNKYFTKSETPVQPVSTPLTTNETTTPQIKRDNPSRIFPILAAAASIALLIFAGSYFMKSDRPNEIVENEVVNIVSPKKIVADYFIKLSIGTRAVDQVDKYLDKNSPSYLADQLKEANKAFDEENFKAASVHFSSIISLKDNPIYDGKKINLEAVKWNFLLCQIAMGPKDVARQKIELFLKSDASETRKTNARKIMEALE